MKGNQLLKAILERLARLDGMSNVFSADEVASWPARFFNSLTNQNLLKKFEPARTVECQGCEQYCFMPVNVLQNEVAGTARAFISCDKRDDIGRVPVDLQRLQQWAITGDLLASKLSEMLGFEQGPKEKQKNELWELGILKGKTNRALVTLSLENEVQLRVGTHEIPLLDVLSFKKEKLSLDIAELLRMVDRATVSVPQYQPSDERRQLRKLETQALHKLWQRRYRELKKSKPGMSDKWYSIQIAKEFDHVRSSETIRKNMKR